MNGFSVSIIVICNLLLTTNAHGGRNFDKNNITVTISQGTLTGKQSTDYWNGKYYSFLGIPYAKAPIGALRFRAPEPAEPWSGIYDATKIRPVCAQPFNVFERNNLIEKSEDCLLLSVETKMSSELKPVMVWIHGGGFDVGNIFENNYGSELLMSEDIVLVKIAYRLSVFGFLSINDSKYDIPGNAGFKDQVMALKWVQKNIHHFRGDPRQVTVFGESAGAASVHLLYLSPLAKGLFHRAIMQSGTADVPWLTSPNTYRDFVEFLECNSTKLEDIVNCINGTSTQGLIDGYEKFKESKTLKKKYKNGEMVPFNVLTIETYRTSCNFLTESPESIAKKGQFNRVPILMGVNTHEGLLFVDYNPVRPNVTDYRRLIPKDVNIEMESKEAIELGETIKKFYYGNQTPSFDLLDPYINYTTDTLIVEKVHKYAKIQSSVVPDVPIYFYHFNYYTKLNVIQNDTKKYVNHFDDCQYLFYVRNYTPEHLDHKSDEYIAIHRMIKLWSTFAQSKVSNPNPINDPLLNVTWLPIELNKFNYLKISQKLELRQDPFKKRMQFWENIYNKYNV